jgi:hypothetical protein
MNAQWALFLKVKSILSILISAQSAELAQMCAQAALSAFKNSFLILHVRDYWCSPSFFFKKMYNKYCKFGKKVVPLQPKYKKIP